MILKEKKTTFKLLKDIHQWISGLASKQNESSIPNSCLFKMVHTILFEKVTQENCRLLDRVQINVDVLRNIWETRLEAIKRALSKYEII